MRLKSLLAAGLCLVEAVFLSGCGFIPMSGPAGLDVRNEQSPTLPFALVKLNPQVVQTLENYEPNVLAGVTKVLNFINSVIGAGDNGAVFVSDLSVARINARLQ
jgi:polysaccharide export outer membrane protein